MREALRLSAATLAVADGGRVVVSGSGDGVLKVWDVRSGALLRTISDDRVDADLPPAPWENPSCPPGVAVAGRSRGGARPPLDQVVEYVDCHREQFGVEPICAVLSEAGAKIAPSTYYARKSRPPSPRAVRDERVAEQIKEVYDTSTRRYGARKVARQLARHGGVDGRAVPRCQVERLMRERGLQGVRRGKKRRTTVADPAAARPGDLVKRDFTAPAPDKLWVVDFT